MSLRSTLLAGCASLLLVTSPALAEGFGTGHCGCEVTDTGDLGGGFTTRDGTVYDTDDFGDGVTSGGIGGAGGEDGNGSSGSSH